MPTFSFHVKVDNTAKVLSALKSATRKTAEEIGDAAVNNVRKLAPVDTGALRDSYMKEVIGDNAVRVGSPLDWAAYQELGTGPNYEQPPGWVTNNVQRGHHLIRPARPSPDRPMVVFGGRWRMAPGLVCAVTAASPARIS